MYKFKSKFFSLLAVGIFLNGCTESVGSFPAILTTPVDPKEEPSLTDPTTPEVEIVEPETPVLVTPKPKPKDLPKVEENLTTGQSPDQLAEVTDEEKKIATAKPVGKSTYLGETIGSLGLLDRPGIWVSTPMVKTETQGRVVFKKTGKSATITLVPLGGDPGAGSQVSLGAMQLLGIPLTDLPVLDVYTL